MSGALVIEEDDPMSGALVIEEDDPCPVKDGTDCIYLKCYRFLVCKEIKK